MKSILITSTLFLLFCAKGVSQVITDSAFVQNQIVTGVLQAPYIFEGEVLSTTGYYNTNQDFIYTSNLVRVNRVWKNESGKSMRVGEILEVITRGGTVDDDMLWITHQIGFAPGQKGMFLCNDVSYPTNPNTSTPFAKKLMLFDGLYFDYDYTKNYISVSFGDIKFECLEKLYATLDPTYIAYCLGVDPNPILYAQKFAQLVAFRTQLLQEVADTDGTVTYTFENEGTVETDGQEYLEFDVYMASSTPVYLGLSTVYIDYNPSAFGQNIVQNSGITIQRGELLPYFVYDDPIPNDYVINNHTIEILAGYHAGESPLEAIDSTPRQLLHVKMKIQDCNALPGLSFTVQDLMLGLTIYYNDAANNNSTNTFLHLIADDVVNSALCGMHISNVSPLEVNAGTGDFVAISGSNFGPEGTVQMKNAEDGGQSWITLDDYDVDWSDTYIKIKVPSVGPLGTTNPNGTYTAGSGPIRIISGNESLETENVNVYYAWKNYQKQNLNTTIKAKGVLSGVDLVYDEDLVNQEYGYKLIPNVNFTNSDARDAVMEAMRRWTCESTIRWSFANNENTSLTSTEDQVSTIRLGTTSSSNRLAETQVRIQRCDAQNSGEEMGFSWAFDIVISDAANHPFFYDETGLLNQPVGFYDFYSVILHELGHAHLLRHVNDSNDLMFWKLLPNTSGISSENRKIFFSPSNTDGVNDILNGSLQTSFANCQYNHQPHEPLTLSNCGTSNSLKEAQNYPIHLLIIPNPSSDLVIIRLDADKTSLFNLTIFDLQGRRRFFDLGINCNAGINDIPIDISKLKKGIYPVMLRNKYNVYTSKLVVL